MSNRFSDYRVNKIMSGAVSKGARTFTDLKSTLFSVCLDEYTKQYINFMCGLMKEGNEMNEEKKYANDEDSVNMKIAWDMAEHAICEKKKVGAILYDNKKSKMIGAGWGGDIFGFCTCKMAQKWEWHFDKSFSMHAEMRAMFQAMQEYKRFDFSDCTMYVTHGPCDQCMKYMTFFNVRKVVYAEPYKVDYTKWLGRGIEVWHRGTREI